MSQADTHLLSGFTGGETDIASALFVADDYGGAGNDGSLRILTLPGRLPNDCCPKAVAQVSAARVAEVGIPLQKLPDGQRLEGVERPKPLT